MQKTDTTPGAPPFSGETRPAATLPNERGGSIKPAPSQKDRREKDRRQGGKDKSIAEREDALDDALDDTFPGSDPVSISPKKPDRAKD